MRQHRPGGFTLLELLIAIAIALALMVGVARLLQTISTTITSGQALSSTIRGQRAIASSLEADLTGTPDRGDGMMSLQDVPFLIITNLRVPAAPNQATFKRHSGPALPASASDNNVNLATFSSAIRTVPADVNNPARIIPIYQYGEANFRVDTFSFFGKGKFGRQTGDANGAPLIDRDFSADHAWIWYGHLNVFTGDPAALHRASGYAAPGVPMASERRVGTASAGDTATPNRNNRTAEQFALGRAAFLLRSPVEFPAADAVAVFNDRSPPTAQPFASAKYGVDLAGTSLAPLASFTPIVNVRLIGGVASQVYLDHTKLADASASEKFTTFDPAVGVDPQRAVYLESFVSDVAGVNLAEYAQRILQAQLNPDLAARWHRAFFASHDRYSFDPDPASPVLSGRFWANPFPGTKLDAAALAQRAHLLHEGCSQFVVEFAGDFVAQDVNAVVADNIPDGTIDFCVVNNQRQIKWYGLPRDVDEDGVVSTVFPWRSADVQPARDMAVAATMRRFTSPDNAFPFEKSLPYNPSDDVNYLSVVGEPAASTVGIVDATGYSCAWGPLELRTPVGQIPDLMPSAYPRGALPTTASGYYRPRMIRVFFEVSDPAHRLGRSLELIETFSIEP